MQHGGNDVGGDDVAAVAGGEDSPGRALEERAKRPRDRYESEFGSRVMSLPWRTKAGSPQTVLISPRFRPKPGASLRYVRQS